MTTAMMDARGSWRLAVVAAATLLVALLPLRTASAEDDGQDDGNWGNGEWHGDGGWTGGESGYGYSAPGYYFVPPPPPIYYASPPPVYYSPPPAYYGPPPAYYAPAPAYYGPTGFNLQAVIPFGHGD